MNRNISGFIMIDSIIALTIISIGIIFFCESNHYMNNSLNKARKELVRKRIENERKKGIYNY